METKSFNPFLKSIKKILLWSLFLGLLFCVFKLTNAQSYLGEGWDRYIHGVQTFAPSNQTGEELAINFVLNLVKIVRNIVGVVALITGVIYGLKLVMGRGQEDVITNQKKNFLYALIGFLILIIAENVAMIFNPEHATSEALIDFGAARDQLRDIVDYLKWMLGSVIVLFMSISSVRLITAGGDEETINKQKVNLTWSLIGMLLILLANNIVNAVYLVYSPAETTAAAPETAITEVASVVRLILVFLGPVAIAFTIYAGFMYLTALDNEDQATRGKKMILTGIVAIVIIYGAYALVNTITAESFAAISPYLV